VSLGDGTTHPFEPPTWNSLEATEQHVRVEKMAKRSTGREVEQEEAIESMRQEESERKSVVKMANFGGIRSVERRVSYI